MAAGFGLPGFLGRWKSDWIDPALDYIEGQKPKSDSHLNDVSIEYPENDIRDATSNFDPKELLGSGTFGSVYKGIMGDGTEVAIKVLQVPEEAGFEEEVKVLSRFRHPNLVILMGFSRHIDTGGRSLIYEYLAGGDVSKRLQRSRQHPESFEWNARLSAVIDAACGLSHLHNMTPRAFHRDIKAPNVLLDRNGTAKMADFGLSCVSSSSHYKVAQASGTVGYACPEYIRSGIITEGSEVHSYGMLVLEILTGAPPAVARPDKPNEFCYLVGHIQGSSAKVMQMLDPTGHFPVTLAQTLTEFAFRCTCQNPADRPLFRQIVIELRHLYTHSEDRQTKPGKSSEQVGTSDIGNLGGQQNVLDRISSVAAQQGLLERTPHSQQQQQQQQQLQQQQQQQQQQHQQNPLNDHEWPSLGGHTSKEKSQAPSDPRSCQTGAASVAASSTPHVPPTWGVSSVSKENSPSLQPHAQTTSVKSVAAKERNARGSLWCHLFISPDMLRPGFDLNKKIIGKGGCYTRGIYEATGAKIRLRGHGSGHLERDGQEAPASLMLAITVETGEAAPFCEAIRMAAELLQGIARRFRSFCGRRGSSEVGRGQPPSATLFWIGELSHRGKLCAAALAEELGLPLP